MEMNFIITTVFNYFNIDPELLHSKTRVRDIAQTRQIAMYFCRKLTKNSLYTIGVQFNKDHSTVIHSCKTVNNLIDTDKSFRVYIEEIERRLNKEYTEQDYEKLILENS